ncbi:hypothetical protein ACHAW5_009492 [Stephanodiscus triporus]|uniref:SprT-like domain-containing protein n=1 Tax=Stephanodiscus triporus TaxID=2934178 RepID=A0ABD3PZ12_9STRA
MTSATPLTLLQRSSLDQNDNCNDADLAQLKERFDKLLPKYGFLWRSMANARLKKEAAAKRDSADGVGDIATFDRPGFQSYAENKSAVVAVAAADKENATPSRWQQQPEAVDKWIGHQDNEGKQESACEDDDNHHSQAKNEGGSDESPPTKATILDAIYYKRPVSLRVGPRSSPDHDELCGDGCDCADPIIEILDDEDEDASAFDVNVDEELADTTDDDGGGGCDDSLTTSGADKTKAVEGVRLNESLLSDDNASIDNDSDDSMNFVAVSKTPKKKVFVLESDEEDESDAASDAYASQINDDHNMELEDHMSRQGNNNDDSTPDANSGKFDDADLLSDEDSKQREYHRLHSLKSKADDSDIIGSDDSDREHEWIELSSDEEEDTPPQPKRVNKVVILSDDEEESESDNDVDDDRSAFTISDDSASSEESEDVSFGKTTREGPTNRIPKGGRAQPKTTSRAKPTERFTTPNENSKPKNNSRSTLAFRKNRDTLTAHTFSEFNQRAFQDALSSVEVTWSKKLNKTAGITRMRGKLGDDNAHTRVATIELSTKVIDDEERLRSTLLHEMCHAAQWLVDGVHKPPHGRNFKKWAAISMRKIRDVEVTTTHDYQIVYKYAWACTASNCKAVIKRHSRSVDPTKHCCGRCKGKLIEIEVPGSKGDTAQGAIYTPKLARKTSEFALFVKEQTTDVRKRLASERSCTPKEISQALVMKECGKLWRGKKTMPDDVSSEPDGVESLADRLIKNCRVR